MRWTEWKFSARFAFQDAWIRWTAVAMAVLNIGMSGFFIWRLVPEGLRSGVITFHYSIYLGIDDVRPWPWMFAIPGIAFLFSALDVLCACSCYRRDPIASRAIMAFGFFTLVLWAVGSFFLILVNI